MHPIMHIHGCILPMQIDFDVLIFDRDVGIPIFVRGADVASFHDPCLPGPAIGEDT
jgi:hypothetical protein